MSMYKTPARSDELYHYGVIGMKWGVRRYQPYTKKLASGNYGQEVGLAAKRRTGKKLAKAVDRNEKEFAKAEAYTEKQKFKAQKANANHPGSARAERATNKYRNTQQDLGKLRTGMARQEDYLSKKHANVRLTTKEQEKWDREVATKARAKQVQNSILLGEDKVKELTKRMNQENQIRDYQRNSETKSVGRKFVEDNAGKIASALVMAVATKYLIGPVKNGRAPKTPRPRPYAGY